MASNKRKQDEKHLKTLREMVSLPINKQCFDCHQRGPTYVDMTIGSFVCTSCSGILRGLNPPHRVKSISMASFTPEEMEVLKSHGNELNRKVYLGLYDSRSWPEPDSRDEQRVRDYMVQKYENKRWYVAPTDAMKDEARRANEAALNSKPQAKPLRSMLGENAPRLIMGGGANQTSAAPSQPSSTSSSSSSIQPPPVKAPPSSSLTALPPHAPVPSSTTNPNQSPAKPSGFDLLGDLGGDPFASSAPGPPAPTNNGGFADFSNFGSFNTPPAQQHQHQVPSSAPPQQLLQQQAPLPTNPAFPISNTPLVPLGSNTPTSSQAPPPAAAPPASSGFMSAGDRYAALADLDSVFSSPAPAATTVNWGGMDGGMSGGMTSANAGSGGSINWGGSGVPVVSGSANPPAQNPASVNWSSNGGGAPVSWNSQPSSSAGQSMGPTPSSASFGAPSTASNPFGGSSQAPPPFASSGSNPNPFGPGPGSSAPPPAFGSTPFQSQQPPQQPQAGGFGAFPVQNGSFGMPSGVFPGQPFGMHPHHQGGWGAGGAGPPPMHQQQPAAANPFMNAASQHQTAGPPSGATNPFL